MCRSRFCRIYLAMHGDSHKNRIILATTHAVMAALAVSAATIRKPRRLFCCRVRLSETSGTLCVTVGHSVRRSTKLTCGTATRLAGSPCQ